MIGAELSQGLWLIRGDAYDRDVETIELLKGITEVTRLFGAAWRVGARVEIHEHALSSEVAEAYRIALIVAQSERGGNVSDFQTLCFSHVFNHTVPS